MANPITAATAMTTGVLERRDANGGSSSSAAAACCSRCVGTIPDFSPLTPIMGALERDGGSEECPEPSMSDAMA